MTSRLSRGLRILELLKDGVPIDPSWLSDLMAVSRRTIFRDIASLKSLGYEIHFDPDAPGYYLDKNDPVKIHANGTSPPFVNAGETDVAACDPQKYAGLVSRLSEAIALRRAVSIKVRVSAMLFSESSIVLPIELTFGYSGWRLQYRASQDEPVQSVRLEEAKFHFDPTSQSSQDD
ncbi:HTH domain protein [Rubripirellula obstinata]|uniref:HTH domain protein n=1 Tax=Rubripirellula obstinata TaxID=406547 RepID=A0A5B1CN00_9BACT|nr:helix-turn-helix domain-containing protein [Rubripirellula obstinata]KAA1260743.1 HTH domain protein [Rubripirellula obstinata]